MVIILFKIFSITYIDNEHKTKAHYRLNKGITMTASTTPSLTPSKTFLSWNPSTNIISIRDKNGNSMIRTGKPTSVEILKKHGTEDKWHFYIVFGEGLKSYEITPEEKPYVENFFFELMNDGKRPLACDASDVLGSFFKSTLDNLIKDSQCSNKNADSNIDFLFIDFIPRFKGDHRF